MSIVRPLAPPTFEGRCDECRKQGGHARTCSKAQRRAPQPRQRVAPVRSAPLRRVGEGKRAWQLLYKPWLAFLIAIDPYCRRCQWIARTWDGKSDVWKNPPIRLATEGHHPFGQLGALILAVLPFCRECHDDVHHKNPKKARDDGWIRDLEEKHNG